MRRGAARLRRRTVPGAAAPNGGRRRAALATRTADPACASLSPPLPPRPPGPPGAPRPRNARQHRARVAGAAAGHAGGVAREPGRVAAPAAAVPGGVRAGGGGPPRRQVVAGVQGCSSAEWGSGGAWLPRRQGGWGTCTPCLQPGLSGVPPLTRRPPCSPRQVIFKHLFQLKYAERQLNNVWAALQPTRGLARWARGARTRRGARAPSPAPAPLPPSRPLLHLLASG